MRFLYEFEVRSGNGKLEGIYRGIVEITEDKLRNSEDLAQETAIAKHFPDKEFEQESEKMFDLTMNEELEEYWGIVFTKLVQLEVKQ